MPFDEDKENVENIPDMASPEAENEVPVEENPAKEEPSQPYCEVIGTPVYPNNQHTYVYQAPKKKGWTTFKVLALVLAASILGNIVGLCFGYFGPEYLENLVNIGNSSGSNSGTNSGSGEITIYQGDRAPNELNIEDIDTSKAMTPAEVYAANVNATVGITSSVTTTNYWGYPSTSAATGSGFIISSDGYIATNYHVVENGSSIKVTLFNDQVYTAKLMGYNEGKDIAVLKIDATDLPCVVLGDSDKVLVGEQIMAIGNPLGELTFSLSVGVVSAVNREVIFAEGNKMKLIQTDCAINSGNSGGPMFNAYGEVIGIATGKYSGATGSGTYIDNIGFAVPINDIKTMLQQMVEKGQSTRAYLGIIFTDVDGRTQVYGVSEGAAISSVDEDSPAAKGGLKANDVIVSFNGQKVKNKEDLMEAVDACKPNQKVKVSIYRSGEKLELEITLGEKVVASEF